MLERIASIAGRLAPWAIIAALGYAAAFVKVDVDADPMPQPLVEQRDRFFGTAGQGDGFWFVGQGGSVLHHDRASGDWRRERLSPEGNLQAVAVSDAGVVVVVGNGGRVWTRAPGLDGWRNDTLPVSEIGNKLLDVAWFDGHFWIVGEMGALFRGEASGQGWTRLREPDDVAFNRIRPGPDGTIWIPAEFGRLLVGRDRGTSWESIELGSESLQAIAFDGTRGLVVGNRGEAFASDDGGLDWQPVATPGREHLYDVIATRQGWLLTGDRGVLQTLDAAGRWQARQPPGLDKGYHARLLAVDDGVVLVGSGIGLFDGNEGYVSWPSAEAIAQGAGS